jgi:hypothetical protein
MNEIIAVLNRVPNADDKRRLLRSVAMLLGLEIGPMEASFAPVTGEARSSARSVAYSTDMSVSPKEFLLEKVPKTDVDRIACLAYYLTHYRSTLYFKTLDLSQLNTEAAQPKFSNAAVAVQNALNLGYLAPATKGQKQISAAGEQFVRLLPDRDAAQAEMSKYRRRKSSRKKSDIAD